MRSCRVWGLGPPRGAPNLAFASELMGTHRCRWSAGPSEHRGGRSPCRRPRQPHVPGGEENEMEPIAKTTLDYCQSSSKCKTAKMITFTKAGTF